MSQTIVYILLLFALALPVLGAVLLRVFYSRMALQQFYSAAGGIFVIALASVLLLSASDVPSLQIGNLSILLPASAPENSGVTVPIAGLPVEGATLEEPTASAAPSATADAAPAAATAVQPTITEAPTAAPTAQPTEMPTAAPTAEPSPQPTEAPTAEPTEAPAPPAPSGPRKYTVQPGDTLRSIAEQFNVSVKALLDANKLTAAQADSLRVGQELVIPSS